MQTLSYLTDINTCRHTLVVKPDSIVMTYWSWASLVQTDGAGVNEAAKLCQIGSPHEKNRLELQIFYIYLPQTNTTMFTIISAVKRTKFHLSSTNISSDIFMCMLQT